MKAGLNLFSIRNLIKTEDDFLATAKKLRDMGYSYLQYSGAPFEPERIERVSRATGLPVYLTHVPMDRIIDDTEKLMDEHEMFGCKNIGLGMMPLEITVNDEKCKQKVAELENAAIRMEKRGFKFFYHHHHYEFYKNADGECVIDYIIKNAPHVNFTLDTYWLQYGGVDILSFIDKVKGRIGCVHLKDYRIFATENDGKYSLDPKFAPVGDGTINFPAVIAKMREAGAEYFFVEQDNAATLPDTLEQVERSIKYISAKL